MPECSIVSRKSASKTYYTPKTAIDTTCQDDKRQTTSNNVKW